MKSIQLSSLAFMLAAIGCSGIAPDGEESAGDAQGVVDEPQLNRYAGPPRALGPWQEVVLTDDAGGLRSYEYQVVDGMAVAEGDMILGSVEDVQGQAKGLIRTDRVWPKRTLVYTLASNLTNTQKSRISNAMTAWTNATGVVFKLRGSEAGYVEFTTLAGVCDSEVGYRGRKQLIRLDATGCGTAAVIHEIGHAFGLEHEHTRSDRDTYIDYHSDRVQTGKTGNFTINNSSAHKRVGASPDFISIMMYDSYAFAAIDDGATPCNEGDPGCEPTLTKDGTEDTWNNTTVLSAGDIKTFRTVYNVFDLPKVKTDRALYTDIRWFANSTTNKVQFCKQQGYTTADTAESTQTLPANTVYATWNSTTKKWDSGQINLAIGAYTKITCKF